MLNYCIFIFGGTAGIVVLIGGTIAALDAKDYIGAITYIGIGILLIISALGAMKEKE